MKKMICSLFLLFAISLSLQVQAQKITKYTYDALGRVTFVEDSNGNRDYDYDAAGNRLNVATSTTNDQASEPSTGLPAAPTGLRSVYAGNCYFNVSWTASTTSGVFYILTDSKGYTKQINGTSTTFNCTYNSSPPDVKPASLSACNSTSCSVSVNF